MSVMLPFGYDDFFVVGEAHPLWPHRDAIMAMLNEVVGACKHGDFDRWKAALASLPDLDVADVALHDVVTIQFSGDVTGAQRATLEQALRGLQPWRKGPFAVGDVHIDTEWRSDWKWQRLLPWIAPLAGRRVLDVGCGSGYHLWRMREAGARHVIGIDPSMLFLCQFQAIQHYVRDAAVQFLPCPLETFPAATQTFDTVFSMGVLYHRRSPIDHLTELKGQLAAGGQLVLETLVVQGDDTNVLVPEGRYARMGNVWFIPSVPMTLLWLRKAGFRNPRVVDAGVTSLEEQRTTDWMPFQSLREFLDPGDLSRTVEGYPAPRRAVFLAEV